MELAAINSPAAALVAGLVTSLHCAGMCGPLACGLMAGRPAPGVRTGGAAADPLVVNTVYHGARLAGYAVLGALAGGLGALPLVWLTRSGARWLPWIFVLAFVGLAFRWDRHLPKLAGLTRATSCFYGWLRGRSRVQAAAALGLATPLLPCGPLYFLLALALLSGSAVRGVEFMLAFGLGTVPLLWLVQTQAHWLRTRVPAAWLSRARVALALATALVLAWRLRGTLGWGGPDPTAFVCLPL